MEFALESKDICAALLVLLATFIAVSKDAWGKKALQPESNNQEGTSSKEEHGWDFKKLTPLSKATIGLAIIGFLFTLYNTNFTNIAANKAKIEARNSAAELEEMKKNTVDTKKISEAVLSQVQEKLPETVLKAVEASQEQIGNLVGDAVGRSTGSLANTIEMATKTSEGTLKGSLRETMELTKTTKGELIGEIHAAKDAFELSAKQSQKGMEGVVKTTVKNLGDQLDDKVKGLAEDFGKKTKDLSKDFEESLGGAIMQIPMHIPQKSHAVSLLGKLKNLLIQVDNVHKSQPISVKICNKDKSDVRVKCNGMDKYNECSVDPRSKKKNEPLAFSFFHKGIWYRMEMMVETNSNIFGSATDFLYCRVVEEDPETNVAKK